MNHQNYYTPLIAIAMLTLISTGSTAQSPAKNKTQTPAAKASTTVTPPALSAIRQQDIKTDIFDMAGDHFRGREAGTLDELKIAVWLAEKARTIGLRPGGDDGTYFQFFNMARNRISSNSTIKIGDHSFPLWTGVQVPQTAPATVDAPILFIDKADTDRADIKGKAVALQASAEGLNLRVSLPLRRYMGYIARRYATGLLAKGAAAVIFIADTLAESSWDLNASYSDHGTYANEGDAGERVSERKPILWLHANALNLVKETTSHLVAQINIEHFLYPSVNVIGIQDGTDPVLKKEYVVFSGHLDHDGIRNYPGTDSIYNGADDNASVNVALMAIARAFHQKPGRRSALFIWHGAEERGLLGSRWYAVNPTVPQSSLVAVLNGDMIGRNSPDSAALLGVQQPHRNSLELVAMGLSANQEGPKFLLDTSYDKPTHNEGWYFRSDHLPYARAGIPALFFTSLLHPDYHTPRDEPSRIDTEKITRIAQWMYRTGWKVANTTKRPTIDPDFKLER